MTTPTAAAGGLFDRFMAVNREAFGRALQRRLPRVGGSSALRGRRG